MPETTARRRAIFLMLVCSLMWSISGIFIKLIPWNPLVISGWRSFIAAICMFLYMRSLHMHLRINRYSLVGGCALAVTLLGFVVANKLTTAANAIVLQFVNPLFILLLSAFVLHQRIRRADVIAVTLTMIGISLFFFDQVSTKGLLGNLIAIASGMTVAIMYVVTGAADPESRLSGIMVGHLIAAVVGVPLTLVFDTPATPTAIWSILILGVVQLGIPYILFALAITHCPPLMCSLISALEPLLNPVWVFLATGERPGIFALCGGCIVILTITFWCIRRPVDLPAEPASCASSQPAD